MNRSTILLLALLLVLGAITLLVLPSEEEQMVSEVAAPVSFTVDSASVVKLSIERSGKALNIDNVGGKWTITSHGNLPADPARVTELIGGLSRFRSGSLVSSNPAKQGLFQVDSSGSHLTLTERSGVRRSIIIGKMGPSFAEVYFRMPGGNDVYLGSGVSTWSLERDVREWRDKQIYASPAEAITGLTLSSGGKTRSYTRDSLGWKSGPDRVATETINPILTALSNLRAEDFIDSSLQFTGTPSRIEINGAIGGELNFFRLGSDTNRYAVQAAGSAQQYIVGRQTALQLFRAVGEPKGAGVAATRRSEQPARAASRAGAEPPPLKESRQPAASESKPVESKPAAAQPPPETRAKETTVNPFRQKDPGEQRPSRGAVVPPAAGREQQTPPRTETGTTRPPSTLPPQAPGRTPAQTPARTPVTTPGDATPPPQGGADDEGELKVHVVKRTETMTSIAKAYGVSVEQILKWNLLKSISVRPGQELYIFVRK